MAVLLSIRYTSPSDQEENDLISSMVGELKDLK